MGYQEEFINSIAPHIVAWRDYLGYGVASAIIAQACLESAYGRSNKAINYHNYFGLKYKEGRVSCNDGYFTDTSSEQLPDGTYITITTKWFSFPDMHTGVEGYYQFINIPRYEKARKAKDPRTYLQCLKEAGYATSIKYVDNVMAIVDKFNLYQYDGGVMMLPDSLLVDPAHTMWSPNKTDKRKYKVDTIIIHCMAGLYDAKRCGELFADPKRQASSHYGISSNGEIWQYVPESARAWTTGGSKKCNGWTGSEYDHRSITIEVSNTSLAPWYFVSAEAMTSIINLCTDICKRNGIPYLIWSNDKKLVGYANLQNVVVHNFFAYKSCPGKFIQQCLPNIVWAVNANLGFKLPGT